MNLYFEKNVINEHTQEKPTYGKKLEIIRFIILLVTIIIVTFLIYYLPWSADNWLFNIALFSIVLGPAITASLFITRILKKNCSEYDYIIANNELKIIRIYNQKKRETILTFDISNIENIGFTSEEDYNVFSQKAEKNYPAFCNKNDDYLFIFGTVKSIKTILICEYDGDLVEALKKSVASYGVYSTEFKKYKG
jgi:hypothetical protein